MSLRAEALRPRPGWNLLRPLKGLLRRPAFIVAEILVITAACVLGASLPQAGRSPAAQVASLRTHGAFVSALVDALSLDHVFTSGWFLGALAFATASLAIVVVEQTRRLRAAWNQVPTEAHFRNAPFRLEFTRPGQGPAFRSIRSRGRLGLAGSPLFHTGLLAVILAGILGALFGVQAVVDLLEGETLPPTVEAWGLQQPGPLAAPFRLDAPLRLVSVEPTRYMDGDLMGLRLKVAEGGAEGGPIQELGINQDLQVSRGRLYADSHSGPTALVAWDLPSSPASRTAVLLERKETQAFGAYTPGPGPLLARIRVPMPTDGGRPDHAEVRILEGGSRVAEATLRPGEALALPGGGVFRLHGLPYWARLHGSRDPAIGLAYAGFIVALAGATLTYGVTRVDELVSVTPEDGRERVTVALKPHRFAPLFQERFAQLVREHGGEA